MLQRSVIFRGELAKQCSRLRLLAELALIPFTECIAVEGAYQLLDLTYRQRYA